MEIIVHDIAKDGLPDMDNLTGRVAFIFDGCIVSGWPLDDGESWEANSDVGRHGTFTGVTHWVEFPAPVWDLHDAQPEGKGAWKLVPEEATPAMIAARPSWCDEGEAEAIYDAMLAAAPAAPVGVADVRWLLDQMRHGPLDHDYVKDEKACERCRRRTKIETALTPPATAPRVGDSNEHGSASGGAADKRASGSTPQAQGYAKGFDSPRSHHPAASEDGLDHEMIALALEYVAGDNSVTFSTTVLRAQANLIRRLAASGQGVEADKAMSDALQHGTGVMRDGKHVPLDQFHAAASEEGPCKHHRTTPRRTHVVCMDCGGVKTDSDPSWGAARARWFPSLMDASVAAGVEASSTSGSYKPAHGGRAG